MKNKIAKLVAAGRIEIDEEPIPKLGRDELLVRIQACGVCGSDLHYFKHGGLGSRKEHMPMWIGHEAAGTVADAHRSNLFAEGDRVVIEPGRSCISHQEEWCMKGKYNLCAHGSFMGGSVGEPGASRGGFSDYAVVHESQLIKIPKSMPFAVAAFMEPLGVALHAWQMMRPLPHATCAIVGAGPIGLALLLVAKKFGLRDIFIADTHAYRLRTARALGATRTFSRHEDYVAVIRKQAKGKGTSYAFDAAGNDEAIDRCVQVVAPAGSIGLVAIPETDYIQINPHRARTKELRLFNVRRSNRTLHECVELFSSVADQRNIQRIITHQTTLDGVQKAFEIAAAREDGVIKHLIVPATTQSFS